MQSATADSYSRLDNASSYMSLETAAEGERSLQFSARRPGSQGVTDDDTQVYAQGACDESPDDNDCSLEFGHVYLSSFDALGKLTEALYDLDLHLEPTIETDSIYGCAIAMPQITRSARWDHTLVVLCFRSYFNLVVNIFIQMALLMFVAEATQVMNPLGNQMHLCDFGKDLETCPDGDHCVGPGGTRFTKTRVYPFSMWNMRNFVRQALLDIVPDRKDEILEKVDPGEYGMECYYCRLMCSFLFTMSVVEELLCSVGLIRLLWILPSENQDWIEYDIEDRMLYEVQPLEHVKFKVAGMSRAWKCFTLCFIVAPKLYICHNVLLQGIILLMDTSGIMDQILGAMSMTFIIGIDEMVYSIFASSATKHIMEHICQHWSNARLKEILDGNQFPQGKRCQPLIYVPRRFLYVCVTMFAYVFYYYLRNCTVWHGTWVSVDMYLPTYPTYHFFNFLLDRIGLEEGAPFWSMSQFDAESVN